MRRRPLFRLEALEPRETPAVLAVTTLSDDPADPGTTLREAVARANSTVAADDIVVRLAGTITLRNALPAVSAPLTLRGPGASNLTISGNQSVRLLEVGAAATAVTVTGVTLADGASAEEGGAVTAEAPLTLSRVVVRGGAAKGDGGGVYAAAGLTILDSEFVSNTSETAGGAVFAAAGLTVTNSTFDGNRAATGGALAVGGGTAARRVVNSTFSANAATADGGAVALLPAGEGVAPDVLFAAVTAAGNTAGGRGGGLFNPYGDGAVAGLANSVVAGNTALEGTDLFGRYARAGNVLGDAAGADFADPNSFTLAASAPVAATLAANGGPTRTLKIDPSGTARGAGDLEALADLAAGDPARVALSSDQRGRSRPAAGPLDAGAFQYQLAVGRPEAYAPAASGATTIAADAGVLANDRFDAYTPRQAILIEAPDAAIGTVELAEDGGFVFTPGPDFAGTATFTYRATDGFSQTADVTVTISPRARLYAVGTGAGGGPRVQAFGAGGARAADVFAFEEGFRGGVRVAVGDVTGDGVDDIVAGSGVGGGPGVKVFDGLTGKLVASLAAYEADLRTGLHLAVGDVDGDGFGDVITGVGSGGGPRVRVFSGKDFEPLTEFFAYDPLFRGGVRVAAADLDGDGLAEIVTTAGPSGGPQVNVYSGATILTAGTRPKPTASFFAFDPAYRGGAFVGVAYSDGRPFVAVTADSFPDYTGTDLEKNPDLPDTAGRPNTLTATNTSLQTGEPRVVLFGAAELLDPLFAPEEGKAATPALEFPVFTGAENTGVRVSGGQLGGRDGVYVGTGPSAGGRLRFYPLGAAESTTTPQLDIRVFGPDALTSVFVAANTAFPAKTRTEAAEEAAAAQEEEQAATVPPTTVPPTAGP